MDYCFFVNKIEEWNVERFGDYRYGAVKTFIYKIGEWNGDYRYGVVKTFIY